ncbi:hypothetical protein TNCV_4473491 [Trichonephila clavipes]|nr:hypothetical protein TNCV_4473491 [Trichonephila clavipes]
MKRGRLLSFQGGGPNSENQSNVLFVIIRGLSKEMLKKRYEGKDSVRKVLQKCVCAVQADDNGTRGARRMDIGDITTCPVTPLSLVTTAATAREVKKFSDNKFWTRVNSVEGVEVQGDIEDVSSELDNGH